MKRLLFAIFVLLIASACNPQQLPAPIVTPYPTYTPYPTDTPYPTWTLTPTEKPTITPVPEPAATVLVYNPTHLPEIAPPGFTNAIAKNGLGILEQNGIVVELYRLIIADYAGIPSDTKSWLSDYSDSSALLQPIFKIYNNTPNKIDTFDIEDFVLVVQGEQVSLAFQATYNYISSNLSGGLLPNAYMKTGLWLGINNTPWDKINEVIIVFPKALDENGKPLTEDFLFSIPIENWRWEQIQP